MANYYAKEFVGVRDGTQPPQMANGGIVDAKERTTRAVKDNTNTLVSGDRIYIGRLPLGAVLTALSAITDTSLSTTTLSIGTLAQPTKYVNAATLTATNAWTTLGPTAAGAVQAPLSAEEDLWATLGVGGIPAAVVAAFRMRFTISA